MLKKQLLTLCFLCPFLLPGQEVPKFVQKGAELEAAGNFSAAIEVYKNWHKWAIKEDNCTAKEEAIYAWAMAEYNETGAEAAIQTITNHFKTASTCPPGEQSGSLYHKLGVFYYLQDDYSKAEGAYGNAIKIRKEVLGEADLSLSRSYHNLGVCLKEKENFEQALLALKSATRIRAKAKADALLADTYYEQAAVYQQMGDHTLALDFLKAALPVFEAEHGELSFETGQTYNEMGITYWNRKSYDQAIYSVEKAKYIFETLYGSEDVDVAKSYINLGNIYDDNGQAELAIEQYEAALDIYNEIDPESIVKALVLNNLGVVYRKLENWSQSKYHLDASLQLKEKILGAKIHPEKAATLDNLGDLSVDQGKLEEALDYYQRAIINRVPTFTDYTVSSNPEIARGKVLGGWQKLLTVMVSKGSAMRLLYDQQKEETILKTALETYYRCDEIAGLLVQQYETRQSKLFLQEQAMLAYEGALLTCYELYNASRDRKYLEDAFFFMEKSRAVLLASRLRDHQAQQNAKIPADLQSKEQNLRAEIAYGAHKLTQIDEEEEVLRQSIQLELVKNRQEFEQFIRELEQTYPRYYKEKYDNKTVSVEVLEQYVQASDAAYLSYFAGSSASFCLQFHTGHWQLFKLPPRANWEPLVLDLQKGLADQQEPITIEDFTKLSNQLYEQLWMPVSQSLPQKLLISPSGALFALPFEILIAPTEEGSNWKKLDYLILAHQFSYVYSASILLEYQPGKQSNRQAPYLGIAPTFESGSALIPLPYNETEIQQVKQLLGGQTLVKEHATKEGFLKEAENYRILHLSTHASTAKGGWIAFSGDNEEEGKLYLPALYPLNLNAELAVLSACETGAGKLSRGEGVLSIAHGLSYAGCPSIVASLWPAYHSTTAEIIASFFEGIKEGENKDKALRDAKLRYLNSESTDALGAHPARWAAFVQMGTPEALYDKHINYWFAGGVIIFILLLFVGWVYRKSKK